MRYLLAAEADKIQDLIFRSSRLREVVGASQLLSRFCHQGASLLLREHGGSPKTDFRVNDGGSFRIIFEDSDPDRACKKAKDFGTDLAELYRLSVGGTLSVADPVKADGSFKAANKEANKALRHAKNHRTGAVIQPHMPYVAFCASCGVALAEQHGRLSGEPTLARARYLCHSCLIKAKERTNNRRDLLDEFLEVVLGSEERSERLIWPEDADTVARYDLRQRNYVAYLVADGNEMGTIFGECEEDQIKGLSAGLTPALRKSLARPTSMLRKRLDHQVDDKGREIVPVLPLILGGDDLFALIPAPYALDFARRFCIAYEEKVGSLVQELGLDVPKPTIAAAVVICKSKYPYALAHRRAEELLKRAKRQSKLLAAHSGERLSVVDFEVILGNRLTAQDEQDVERHRAIRATMRPYWAVAKGKILSSTAQEYGIGLDQLLAQRLELKDVPHKRLIELRKCFADLPQGITVNNRIEHLESWTKRLKPLFTRSGKTLGPKLQNAMEVLGQHAESGLYRHHWHKLRRDGESVLTQGMLDLLEAWDFAQDLDNLPEAYEAEEIEE
jgi:hypothetical protein